VIDTTEEEMRRQKLVDPECSADQLTLPDDRLWPMGGRGPVDPTILGLDKNSLAKAVDAAFAEPNSQNPPKTRAVVIAYRGHLVAERYAPGFHKDMPLLGWSMGKSITNALVGILVGEGRLDIRRPAPVPEWRSAGDPRGQITLDQLLRMSSGLAFEEIYEPLRDVTYMLYGSYDFAAFGANMPLETAPNTRWSYSSGTANIIARIVRHTLEQEGPYYYGLIREKLFDRIGMTSAFIEPDSSGTIVGSSYGFATPRDWAKFGQLYLDDGVWQGKRILPEGWVTYTTTPTPLAPQGGYGALFWLNSGAKDNPADRRWPNAPVDTFAALGFQEQNLIIIPSK
jgi:CubicO group peptidase (beta-lactamase class C family)